jgi:hypothetical protein
MVTIVDYKSIEKEDGESFLVLVLQGGVEPVKSQATGKIYFTARTANVPATFDEITCKSLVGSQFEGIIRKVKSEPYQYTIKETGEIVKLDYRYEYVIDTDEIIKDQVIEEEFVA